MNPIVRRRSFFFVSSAVTYLAIMGRYLVTRDWTAFEIIPLFMPIWIVSALLAAESDERYAFLRTLPMPDADIVRAKFTLILASAALQWVLMTAVAVARMEEGIAGPSTVVYLTIMCASGLLAAAGFQIAIWKYGVAAVQPVLIASIAGGIVLAILHLWSLKRLETWPALSQLAAVEWLGRAPWIASVVLGLVALAFFGALLRIGVRVKAASEAHL